MKVTGEMIDEIVKLRLAGRSITEVAKTVGVSDWTVKKVWRERGSEAKEVKSEAKEAGRVSARVVKMALNPRLVLVEVDGEKGIKRLIVKPAVRKRMGVGKVVRRVERIEGDLWRMVGIS